MSRFRAAMQALRGPLEYAGRGPEALERVRDLRETLQAALARAAALAIPPAARQLLLRAQETLNETPALAQALARVGRTLAPLLEAGYPLRALSESSERLAGVGPKTAAALARKEIHSIEDLLFFLPRVYEDRRQLLRIEQLEVGHPACFEARVTRAGVVPLRSGRRFFESVVSDGSGAVQLKWFRGFEHLAERLRPGARVLVSGDVRRYRFAKELHHPELELLDPEAPRESLGRIIPVYSAVEGIPPRSLRRLVASAVTHAADLVDEALPEGFAERLGLPELCESLREVHVPSAHLDPGELLERRTRYHLRLCAEELFLLQAGLALLRGAVQRRVTRALAPDDPLVRQAIEALPFALTRDQLRVWSEISSDLRHPHPMHRLLVGDVGAGKTVLAFLAMVAARAAGALSALLAPTELLAEQHAATFARLGEPLGLRPALLTGSTSAAERRALAHDLERGALAAVIGTHALLSGALALPELRLAVIDEQHRFGVLQRQLLRELGEAPHVLVMTATPIPRTLALTLFGDLEQSVLREAPPGRARVETRLLPESAAREALEEIRRTVRRGEQVYVVYPLIEESEKQDLLDATRGFERISRALPGVRCGLLHGRLEAGERVRAMGRFAAGEVQVLVSTTVIEVGVDVPNATLLVVRHADRFGLAQLHQLRGRVGRGLRPGRALLLADARGEGATRRLAILERSSSGFDIADADLAIRGPGEWLGTRQAGHLPELRIADLVRHAELLEPVREAAGRLVSRDPALERHPELRAAIERRWGRRLAHGWD